MTKYVRQFIQKPAGVIGAAVFAPWIAPYDPYQRLQVQQEDILAPPDSAHLLGRDDAGRDVLSQLIYGARVSLLVGFTASFFSMFTGQLLGWWQAIMVDVLVISSCGSPTS